MLVAEIQELDEVKTLVVKGQQDGVISYGEVATAVSEVDLDESDIEELYAYIERQGVELVEDVDPAQAAAAPERDTDKRGKRRKATALDLKPDMTPTRCSSSSRTSGRSVCSRPRRRWISPSASSASTSTQSRRWSSRTSVSSSR